MPLNLSIDYKVKSFIYYLSLLCNCVFLKYKNASNVLLTAHRGWPYLIFQIGLSVECHFSLDSPVNTTDIAPIGSKWRQYEGISCCLESKLEN